MALLNRLSNAASTNAFRLMVAAIVAFLLATAALTWLLFRQSNAILTEQALTQLRAESQLLQSEYVNGGPAAIASAVAALSRPEGAGLYFLAGADNNKIAGNLASIPAGIQSAAPGGVFRYRPAAKLESETVAPERLAVVMPVALGSGMKLFVGRDIEDQRAFADHMKKTFVIGFGALSLLGLLGGLLFSRLILNRIDTITATSRSIMEGDLSQRIPLQGDGGELDELAVNLNSMLERIEGLMSGLREVSDNIAHDLKTPLNRLRNSAEQALRDGRGGEAYREGLERTIEKADDLIKTFNALLLIARLEAGPLEESLEIFDLSGLVEDVAELYSPAAEEAGFSLCVEAAPRLYARANRQLIGQALSNLIDNAIKYSRGQVGGEGAGAIKVQVQRERGTIAISVSDCGPGIPEADRQRVLKRFVRLEKSRTLPGTGLGLSLVAAVARLHHGSVRVEDNAPGLRIVLVLSGRAVIEPGSEPAAEPVRIAAQ